MMMKNLLPVWIVAVVLVVCANAPLASPTLKAFDEDVATSRRVLRQYCAIAQNMAGERELDTSKRDSGLALLREFRAQWTRIQEAYAADPPAEYARDPLFGTRLQDIANAAEDMEKALAAEQPRRSVLACGFACGLFVSLHEENGLTYALDKLFHLRRAGRAAASVLRTRGLDEVRPWIAALLRLRDEVLLAPLPWAEGDARNEAYAERVRTLSETLDHLALSAAAGRHREVERILSELTPVINQPYGLAL